MYKGITKLWQMIVCEKPKEEEWHKKKCMYGQCISCGVNKFPFFPMETNDSTKALVEWRQFAMEINNNSW